jgi:hypothetical protein
MPSAVLVVCGLLLAACGSSGHAPTYVLATPSVAERPKSGAEVDASIVAAIAACKRAVTNARTLPAAPKAELKLVCNRVVDRTGKEARELRQVLCEEVANASSSRSASVREQVRKECEAEAAR